MYPDENVALGAYLGCHAVKMQRRKNWFRYSKSQTNEPATNLCPYLVKSVYVIPF